MNQNEIYHHGIYGQQWGVRRYQNYDGSLTPEGRERYGYSIIEKGSTVRRVSSTKKPKEKNPVGLYTYANKEDEEFYKRNAKYLPSVYNNTGLFNTAKVTQYEFVKDAKLLEGKKSS